MLEKKLHYPVTMWTMRVNGHFFWMLEKEKSIIIVKENDLTASILVSKKALAKLGYNAFEGTSSETGGYDFSDVSVVGDKGYIEIHQVVRAPQEDIGWRYAYRRVRTVVYETTIGSDELKVLYQY